MSDCHPACEIYLCFLINACYCVPYFLAHKMQRDFFVRNFRKNNDERILILVIYWKKTGLLHTKLATII